MKRICANNQKQKNFFPTSGQGNGELCTSVEKTSCERVVHVPDRRNEQRSWDRKIPIATIAKDKVSENATQTSKLLGRSQTQNA
jgi:hypothetical protein